jgi:hypothetical protein
MVDVLGDARATVASTLAATTVAKTVSLTFFILTLLSSNRHLTDATDMEQSHSALAVQIAPVNALVQSLVPRSRSEKHR